MKKKLIAALLVAATVGMALTGCSQPTECPTSSDSLSGKATNGGTVLNIRCWNDEFQRRFRAYSTDYVKTLDNGDDLLRDGTVVRWNIVANDNNGYQIALDAALLEQDNAKAEDKIDVFLAEADYILKYTASDYALDVVKDIGLTQKDLGDMYQYTKDIASYNGALKGVSWQAAPGLFAYRRDIALDVLGTDDPVEVQKKMSDWDKFEDVAAQMYAKNYRMLSGYDDSYRTFSNNTSQPWVVDGVVKIDPMIKRWVDQTKEFADAGYIGNNQLWKPGWTADQAVGANVFGFFYSTWGINFTLQGNYAENGVTKNGDWAVIEGPASYYWGGTWIIPCKGTDNQKQILRMIQDICCSTTIAERFTRDTLDYTNNKTAMHKIATDEEYGSEFLGGQNHIALFELAAAKISMKNMTAYDQGCNEQFQNAMRDYFAGTKTYEEALQNFKQQLKTLYADLQFDF
jgi:hypothetical protein